jgi:quercetin dioxygenase-like cupin family protein
VVRGIGVSDLRNVTVAPWKRMGGNGAFFELEGVQGFSGIYLLEIPARGATPPKKHLYEENFYVVEGRGQTEVWRDGSSKKQTFEWQKGSLFSAPMNTMHRLINSASTPALVLCVNNAPAIFNLLRSESAIFSNSAEFPDRYDEQEDYFKPIPELARDTNSGRARSQGNLLPDILNCDLPLDQQRGVGHRHFGWRLANNSFQGFVAQYASGRYSKSHAHEGGPVLLCLRGSGYSITWPKEAGMHPYEDGKGDLVKRLDYSYGGIVSAAPGTSDWFHGHFGASKEGFRVCAFLGGFPRRVFGVPGEEQVAMNEDITKGGNTIEYHDEDPHIRKMFQDTLAKNGAKFEMPDDIYDKTRSRHARR